MVRAARGCGTEDGMQSRSWIALLAGVFGGLAIVDLLLGPALASTGLVAPMTGFGVRKRRTAST